MRFDYSPELEDYRTEVRAFIARHGPGPRKHVGVRAPDPEQVPALRAWVARLYAAGYLGQTWPVEHGGRPGATVERTFIVAEEIARARTWGEIGAGGLAAGSDLASLKTRAVRDGDHSVVNGQKVWTTNGHHADLGYLLARTNPDVAKQAGITAFALDMRTPGVDVRPLREITGTSDFNEVFLDNVRIPADQAIGEIDNGWRVANASLGHERSGVGARAVELYAQLDDLVEFARRTTTVTGTQSGRPAIADGATRQRIGRLAALAHVTDVMSKAVQSRIANGTEDAAEAAGIAAFCSGEFVDHEAYSTLAEMALQTERAQVGPGIAYAFARTPYAHAAGIRGVWRHAPGRVFLGLGSGAYKINRDWFGVAADRPVARMADLVGAVRAWLQAENGQRVRYEGEFHHIDAVVGAPVLGRPRVTLTPWAGR